MCHAVSKLLATAGQSGISVLQSGEYVTYYQLDESRGHPALDTFFVEEFAGVLVSDFWAAYDAVGRTKQKCWPHALRELSEVDPITVTVTVVGEGRTVIANLADPTGQFVGGSKELWTKKTTTFTVQEVSATGKYTIVIASESISDFKLTVKGPAAESLTVPALAAKVKRLEKEVEKVKAKMEKIKEKK